MKGDTTEHTHRWRASEEEYSVASLPVEVLQSHIPCTTDQEHSKETNLGGSTLSTREQTPPLTGQWQSHSKSVTTQYPGYFLVTTTPVKPLIRVITASIHWGKRWQTSRLQQPLHQKQKKIKPMQATQGCSHLKMALQDSLRVWPWEEEPPEHLVQKASGFWLQEPTGLGETDSILGGCTQGLTHTGTQHKAVLPKNLG